MSAAALRVRGIVLDLTACAGIAGGVGQFVGGSLGGRDHARRLGGRRLRRRLTAIAQQ
jgi:hypothetical protein